MHVDSVYDVVGFYKQCMIRNQSTNNAFTFNDVIQIPLVIETII